MHKLVQNDKSSKENLNYFAFLDSLPLLKISMAHLLGNHPRILSSQLTLSPYSQCLKTSKIQIELFFSGHNYISMKILLFPSGNFDCVTESQVYPRLICARRFTSYFESKAEKWAPGPRISLGNFVLSSSEALFSFLL